MEIPKSRTIRLVFLLLIGALCLMFYVGNRNIRNAVGNIRHAAGTIRHTDGNIRHAGENMRVQNGDTRREHNLQFNNGNTRREDKRQYNNGNTRKSGGSSQYDKGNSKNYATQLEDRKRQYNNENTRIAVGNSQYDNGNSRNSVTLHEDGKRRYTNGSTGKSGGSSRYDNGDSRHHEGNVDENKRLLQLRGRCEELFQRGEIENKDLDTLNTDRIPFRKLVVSHKHKLIACKVGKVASTNLQRIFGFLEGVFDTENCTSTDCLKNNEVRKDAQGLFLSNQARIHGYTSQDMKILLSEYKTFFFTREPLERLLSAYRMASRDINFDTFVDNILRTGLMTNYKTVMGVHLEVYHQHRICRPCAIRYDFIGEMATYDRDIRTVLQNVSVLNFTVVPDREQTGYRKANSSSVVNEYYRQIPDWKIHKLWELYHVDYYLYGYDYPSHLMSAG